MTLKLERFWRSQPPSGGINWGHPRARDLVFFAPLGLSHGLRDLVTGQSFTRTGLTTTASSGGIASPLFGTSSYADFTRPAAITEFTPFTLAWTQEPISATGYHTIINVNFGTAGLHNQFVVYQASSDSAYNFVVGPRGTGGSSAGSPRFDVVGLTTNRQRNRFVLQALAGSQSLSTSNYVLWRDGVRLTTTATASLGAATAALARIGARDAGADPFEGAIQDMRMWARVLTDPEAEAESRFERAAELYEPRKIWLPVSTATGAYTLTADAASFTLTGVETGLIAARSLTADQQSYSLTGVAANLLRGFSLTADQASFALSGVDAGLTTARLLTADQQTYTLTGVDAGLTYTPAGAYTLTADVGTFTLTGNAAGLNYYKLTADTVAFAFTGNDATLTYAPLGAYTLTADSGSFALTGNAAGLSYAATSTVWDYEVEPGVTAAQAMRLILAAVSGKTSGIGTATEVYFAPDGVTPRITATFDSAGNRVAVELNGG